MQEKYEKLFYEFTPEDTKWGDVCVNPQAYFRGAKDMPGATMSCGFQVFKKPILLQPEAHFHPCDENLVFLGGKLPDVFSSFDAEIHFYMGPTPETMEKIVITEPTIIKVPKNYWHGPLNFVRVDKPLLFQAVMFSGNFETVELVERENGEREYLYSGDQTRKCVFDKAKDCTYCGECFVNPEKCPAKPYTNVKFGAINEDGVALYSEKGAYDDTKAVSSLTAVVRPDYTTISYSDATTLIAPKPALTPETSKLVLAMPKEETKWGAWCPSPQAYFRGDIYMEDANYNIGWQIFAGANDTEAPHFHQGVDEYIFFMGSDPENFFDFDCDIDFAIGDDPDHMEHRKITKPTVVRIPPTVWHCPILFRKVTKPVMFQAAFMHGTWGTITRNEGGSGHGFFESKYTYEYMGDNVRYCRYNDKKRCNICGACFGNIEIKED